MELSPRERLIETAKAMFDREGYHATGIDRILAEAGVAKMTLYKHFASKEALILEALQRRDAELRERLTQRARALSSDARGRLVALFDALGEWFDHKDFHGCMFTAAAAEFGTKSRPIRAAARDHKRMIAQALAQWSEEAGARDPELLGRQLAILVDGATVAAQMGARRGAAEDARAAAEVLVAAAVKGGRRR